MPLITLIHNLENFKIRSETHKNLTCLKVLMSDWQVDVIVKFLSLFAKPLNLNDMLKNMLSKINFKNLQRRLTGDLKNLT